MGVRCLNALRYLSKMAKYHAIAPRAKVAAIHVIPSFVGMTSDFILFYFTLSKGCSKCITIDKVSKHISTKVYRLGGQVHVINHLQILTFPFPFPFPHILTFSLFSSELR